MLKIDIPGRAPVEIASLVLDYNGTIAVDGALLDELKPRLSKLAEVVKIYILTADTYGTVREETADYGIEVKTFPQGGAACAKADIVRQLPDTCCFGNGFNDIEMFKVADFSVAIVEGEGMCAALLPQADVVVRTAAEAFDLLLKPDRLRATLRT